MAGEQQQPTNRPTKPASKKYKELCKIDRFVNGRLNYSKCLTIFRGSVQASYKHTLGTVLGTKYNNYSRDGLAWDRRKK